MASIKKGFQRSLAQVREAEVRARMAWGGGAGPEADAPADASGPGAPPTVTRGEHPVRSVRSAGDQVELVLSDGVVKFVTKRTGPDGEVGFIDWLNFTFHEDSAHGWGDGTRVTDDEIVCSVSWKLEQIFGFGITTRRDKGIFFWRRSWVLGDGYGFVGHGGQRNTVLVVVNGEGLAAAMEGWERRLHDFLTQQCVAPKLTRVDVSHDCFEGEYTVDQADSDYDAGLFRLPKSPGDPECERRGNWKRITGKGRSFYVGVRTSGKYLRVYEKGKQLGAPDSPWVRVEVEYKSVDRVIPFDILLEPGTYLAGAYPALVWIRAKQQRIRTVREQKVCEKAKKEAWITRQCGKDLRVLVELEVGDTFAERCASLIQRLQDDSDLPKWAKLPGWQWVGRQLHHDKRVTWSLGGPSGAGAH